MQTRAVSGVSLERLFCYYKVVGSSAVTSKGVSSIGLRQFEFALARGGADG